MAETQSSVDMPQPVDSSQHVTSKIPVTKQKNPKRVAAAKAIADKTKQARQAQKKALAEAQIIIVNEKLQKKSDPPVVEPPVAEPQPAAVETTRNVLTTTQWLSVISIFLSMVGIYYEREEIKNLLTKKPPQTPPPSPVDVSPKRKGGIRPMD